MTRTVRIGLALIACLAPMVVGCGGSSSGDGRTTLTVALDWTPNTNHAGVYLAKLHGYYAQAGIDVDIIEPDQNGAMAQLAAANADVGFSAAEQLLPARAQGARVTSIATVMRTNTSSLIMPADRAITRPRDLESHTYGGYGGELETALVKTLVACDGGDPSRVRFSEVGNVDYSVGFRRHQYDAVWVFDGWDTVRLRELQHMKVTTIAFRDELDCIPDWYTPILVARDDLLVDDPQLIRTFLAATARGYQDLAADPSSAADEITSTMSEADPELWRRSARFIAPFLTDTKGGWGYQEPGVWESFNTFLKQHRLATVADLAGSYTNEYLPES